MARGILPSRHGFPHHAVDPRSVAALPLHPCVRPTMEFPGEPHPDRDQAHPPPFPSTSTRCLFSRLLKYDWLKKFCSVPDWSPGFLLGFCSVPDWLLDFCSVSARCARQRHLTSEKILQTIGRKSLNVQFNRVKGVFPLTLTLSCHPSMVRSSITWWLISSCPVPRSSSSP